MADIHLLSMNQKQDLINCVFHIAVPDQTNFAGYSYRTALVEYLDSLFEPQYSGHTRPISVIATLATDDPTEYAQIETGEMLEREQQVHFSALANNATKWATVQAEYTAQKTSLLQQIQNRLEFWKQSGAE